MDLDRAAEALEAGDLAGAERLCRDCVRREPRNPAALRLLAEIGLRFGRPDDAESLLRYCLDIAPGFHPARRDYADLLFRNLRFGDALREIDTALAVEPEQASYQLLKGAILAQAGRTDDALGLFDTVLERFPDEAGIQINRGRALQTAGRHAEAVAAFRAALAIDPDFAEAWWSLSDLKTVRFDGEDVARMRRRLDTRGLPDQDLIYLSFALGKALEDLGDYDESFSHYARGNHAKRRTVFWDADRHHADVDAVVARFDAAFFASRHGWGHPSPAPIFIVGLPRAGSTLLEQILASHSRVAGTMELPEILSMARRLAGNLSGDQRAGFMETLAALTADDFVAMGAEYLERTAIHRGDDPFFVDKMPNNFIHVGLIHLMLPNAKIIDARRRPMACGFSLFKQLFAHGQTFSYDLGDIGRYYGDYASLMSHWDTVLPGRVLRVDYEDVVADTETQVRRILAHCGLDFEPGCLEFYRSARQVRTASSEQVRQPIYRRAIDGWRNYASQLEPLSKALGPLAG